MPVDAAAARNPVALVVLASLAEQPRHPYEIQRLMRERHTVAAGKTRALYAAVQRLQASALIEAVETTREGNRPERTVYRITDAGREALLTGLRDRLAATEHEFPPFAAALSLAAVLRPDEVARALEHRAVALEAALAALETTLRAAAERLSLPRVLLLEVEYMVARHRAELQWSLDVAADIRAGRLGWSDPSGADGNARAGGGPSGGPPGGWGPAERSIGQKSGGGT